MSNTPPRRRTDKPAIPRWVVLTLLAGVVLLIAIAVLHLSGAMPMGHGM